MGSRDRGLVPNEESMLMAIGGRLISKGAPGLKREYAKPWFKLLALGGFT